MAMFNLTHSQVVIDGGNYTQVNNVQNNNRQQTPWDRLQSAAAPSAFHDSGDQFDAPKCHPNTRVAVINELRDFSLRRGDTGHAKILWLNGAAGAGKSAIARSLCEECASTNSLLASFFFNRSDPSRDNHKAFVATLTYQIFGYVPQHYQTLVLGVIERDPLVFRRSVDAQLQALIVRPLFDLFRNGYFSTIGRCLIAIDGLDECSTTAAQLDILRGIQRTFDQAEFPFIFIIASRPETEIQTCFMSSSMVSLLRKLELDDSYLPDVDIERFLVDKLQETCDTHPFRDSLPTKWPSTDSFWALVQKSSGQFIYASVVVKYVTSPRHRPDQRLGYVLNLCPPKGDLPFAELDALYSHILSSAENVDLALRIVAYSVPVPTLYPILFTIEQLARIMRVDHNDCLVALSDLLSVLSVATTQNRERIIRLSHKSFLDYLAESARSGKYHLNATLVLSELMGKCFQYVSDVVYTPDSLRTRYNIITFWNRHNHQLINTIASSHKDLTSFSLMDCYNTFSSPETRSPEETALFNEIFCNDFFFSMLNCVRLLVASEYGYLYYRYLNQFRELIGRHPDIYRPALVGREPQRVASIVTVLILASAKPSRSQMPLDISELITSSAFTVIDSGFDGFPRWLTSPQISSLLHDAALQCFYFLKCDIDTDSVAAALRYLTWALPHAAESTDLEAACTPGEPFAYASIPGDNLLFDRIYEVVIAMRKCRQRCSLVLARQIFPVTSE